MEGGAIVNSMRRDYHKLSARFADQWQASRTPEGDHYLCHLEQFAQRITLELQAMLREGIVLIGRRSGGFIVDNGERNISVLGEE